MQKVGHRLLYVERPETDFHAGIPQLICDVIEVPGGHHNSDVTANAPGACPEVCLQRQVMYFIG